MTRVAIAAITSYNLRRTCGECTSTSFRIGLGSADRIYNAYYTLARQRMQPCNPEPLLTKSPSRWGRNGVSSERDLNITIACV